MSDATTPVAAAEGRDPPFRRGSRVGSVPHAQEPRAGPGQRGGRTVRGLSLDDAGGIDGRDHRSETARSHRR